ncbi:MAG TPA: ROK family transcriptional regulator [Actinospica sp.]|nr:ROK family transcriptional regulator [Actinospica sp.]
MTRTAVLAVLARSGPLSRAEIAERLELSPATLTAGTRRLLAEGLIVEGDPRSTTQTGRPSIPLALVPESVHVIGVQVAHEHVTGVLTRLDAEIVHGFRHAFDPAAPDALGTLIALLRAEIAETARRGLRLAGLGVAVPGVVDPETGTLRMSVRLGWTGMPLAAKLRQALGLPVFVDNDISAVTAAERLYGPGAECADFLLLAIGQGIGLGMVLDGAPYRGAAGAAGEFGHLPVLADGPLCSCGNHGCLETQVSTEALLSRAEQQGILAGGAELEDLRDAADRGDQAALALLGQAGELLGRSLAGTVNLLGPERVVLIGEIVPLWPHLAGPFGQALARHLLPGVRDIGVDVRPWDDRLIAAGAARVVLGAPLAAPRQRG